MEPIKKTLWIKKAYSADGLYDLYLFDTPNTELFFDAIKNDVLCSKNFPELNLKDYETAKIKMTITKVDDK